VGFEDWRVIIVVFSCMLDSTAHEVWALLQPSLPTCPPAKSPPNLGWQLPAPTTAGQEQLSVDSNGRFLWYLGYFEQFVVFDFV
jgi:hypothetical protein